MARVSCLKLACVEAGREGDVAAKPRKTRQLPMPQRQKLPNSGNQWTNFMVVGLARRAV